MPKNLLNIHFKDHADIMLLGGSGSLALDIVKYL